MATKAMNIKMDEDRLLDVKEASAEESTEILSEIETLTDDDLEISSAKKFTV